MEDKPFSFFTSETDKVAILMKYYLNEQLDKQTVQKLYNLINSDEYFDYIPDGIVDYYKYSKNYKNNDFYQKFYNKHSGNCYLFKSLYFEEVLTEFNHHDMIRNDDIDNFEIFLSRVEKECESKGHVFVRSSTSVLDRNKSLKEVIQDFTQETILNNSINCFNLLFNSHRDCFERSEIDIFDKYLATNIEYYLPFCETNDIFKILEENQLINYFNVVKCCIANRTNKDLLIYSLRVNIDESLRESIGTTQSNIVEHILMFSGFCLKEIIDNISFKIDVTDDSFDDYNSSFVEYLIKNDKFVINERIKHVLLLTFGNVIKSISEKVEFTLETLRNAFNSFSEDSEMINQNILYSIIYFIESYGIEQVKETLTEEDKVNFLRAILVNINSINNEQFSMALSLLKQFELSSTIDYILDNVLGFKFNRKDTDHFITYWINNENVVNFLKGLGYEITLNELDSKRDQEEQRMLENINGEFEDYMKEHPEYKNMKNEIRLSFKLFNP